MAVVIGSGGHGKVVVDALLTAGVPASEIEVRDADAARAKALVLGIPVKTPDLSETLQGRDVHVAIGSCAVRGKLYTALGDIDARPLTIAHPAANVSRSAQIGHGSFVAAQAVIGPDTVIGAGVIINHGAVVDHDCVVGAFSHVAPNATLGGGAKLGEAVLVGSGAVILPGVAVGDGAVIGAGAVVTHDVPAGETWIGNPARKQAD